LHELSFRKWFMIAYSCSSVGGLQYFVSSEGHFEPWNHCTKNLNLFGTPSLTPRAPPGLLAEICNMVERLLDLVDIYFFKLYRRPAIEILAGEVVGSLRKPFAAMAGSVQDCAMPVRSRLCWREHPTSVANIPHGYRYVRRHVFRNGSAGSPNGGQEHLI
jgi:hypothetical protein